MRTRQQQLLASLRFAGLTLALVLLASCQDASAPLDGGPQFDAIGYDDDDSSEAPWANLLRQASGAPALETYQTSFWVYRGGKKDVSVRVNYLPEAGHSTGEPFLSFFVPKDGLRAGGDGRELAKKDSVLITMTIDPSTFLVDFEPSGVVFDKHHPAELLVWYQNANPDLNGDGTVDAADDACAEQIRIVTRANGHAHWHPTKSEKGWAFPFVYAPLKHFSQYGVSW